MVSDLNAYSQRLHRDLEERRAAVEQRLVQSRAAIRSSRRLLPGDARSADLEQGPSRPPTRAAGSDGMCALRGVLGDGEGDPAAAVRVLDDRADLDGDPWY